MNQQPIQAPPEMHMFFSSYLTGTDQWQVVAKPRSFFARTDSFFLGLRPVKRKDWTPPVATNDTKFKQ